MNTADLLDWLRGHGFTPQDDSGPYESWFDRGPIRVVVAGTAPEVDEILVHAFTDDPARLLVWSASFTPGIPIDVVAGAIGAAIRAV